MPGVPIEMPSDTVIVLNSTLLPPASSAPAPASRASPSMCMLHGVTMLHVDAMPTCGLAKSSSLKPTARSIARLGACVEAVDHDARIAARVDARAFLLCCSSSVMPPAAGISGQRLWRPGQHGATVRRTRVAASHVAAGSLRSSPPIRSDASREAWRVISALSECRLNSMIRPLCFNSIEPMDPADSGIFRLASVGTYLDALSTITDEMSLKERSNLIFLDRCLHEHWGLGQNVILNWCPRRRRHLVARDSPLRRRGVLGPQTQPCVTAARRAAAKAGFLPGAVVRPPLPDARAARKVGRLLGVAPTHVTLREPLKNTPAQNEIIEKMVKRYSITYVPNRGVCAVRHRGIQPADAVRADDAAEQPLLLAELCAEQAVDEAHRRRFLAHDDRRRVLHLEP